MVLNSSVVPPGTMSPFWQNEPIFHRTTRYNSTRPSVVFCGLNYRSRVALCLVEGGFGGPRGQALPRDEAEVAQYDDCQLQPHRQEPGHQCRQGEHCCRRRCRGSPEAHSVLCHHERSGEVEPKRPICFSRSSFRAEAACLRYAVLAYELAAERAASAARSPLMKLSSVHI
jgi:hypothetical protein